jgi:hypothetical protein
MNHQLRLLVVGGVVASAFLIFAVGLARNDAELMAPANLILFLLVVAVYLLPTALAVFRNCKATGWIVAVNVLLGWTLLGWVVALGWAASGKVRAATPAIGPPPSPALHGR